MTNLRPGRSTLWALGHFFEKQMGNLVGWYQFQDIPKATRNKERRSSRESADSWAGS
jgi:hypothetical protein